MRGPAHSHLTLSCALPRLVAIPGLVALLGLVAPLTLSAPVAMAESPFWGCPLLIDDFSQGGVQITEGPLDYTVIGLPTESCYGGRRQVIVQPHPGHKGGMTYGGGGDYRFFMETESQYPQGDAINNADVILHYDFAQPIDVTQGGANDRVIVDVVSESYLTGLVRFKLGNAAHGFAMLLNPGENVFLLSSNSTFDFTQVDRFSLHLYTYGPEGEGDGTISRIRLTGPDNPLLNFEVPSVTEYGPPWPVWGPYFNTWQEVAGVQTRTTQVGLLLNGAIDLGSRLPLNVAMTGSDNAPSGERVGTNGAIGFVQPAVGKAYYQMHGEPDGQTRDQTHGKALGDAAFDFTVDIQPAGSQVPLGVVVDDSAEGTVGGTFHIPFEVEVYDQPTALIAGTNSYTMRVQVDDPSLEFSDVRITPPVDGATSFDVSFELLSRGARVVAGMAAPGIVAPGMVTPGDDPLFTVSMVGDWFPEVVTTAAPSVAPTMVLSAWPSVASDRTVLRLEGANDAGGQVRVIDVRGRVVRRLAFAPGKSQLVWDTRNDRGVRVPSGVYFAQATFNGQRAVRRITVMR